MHPVVSGLVVNFRCHVLRAGVPSTSACVCGHVCHHIPSSALCRRHLPPPPQLTLARVAFAHLTGVTPLGGGFFGDVFRACFGGAAVAVKKSALSCTDKSSIDKERALLQALPPHPHVVRACVCPCVQWECVCVCVCAFQCALCFHTPAHRQVRVLGICDDAPDGCVRIVMELCLLGNLRSFLDACPQVPCVCVCGCVRRSLCVFLKCTCSWMCTLCFTAACVCCLTHAAAPAWVCPGGVTAVWAWGCPPALLRHCPPGRACG